MKIHNNNNNKRCLGQKPMSAYIGISIMCVLIAFGGFVFGFDTGTISGLLICLTFRKIRWY